MGLLDRVSMLVRANLNDLIDRAEDPEKMLKQVILDMQNQLMQLKTQVALAMADTHQLRAKAAENGAAGEDYLTKAHLAMGKGKEDLARTAVEKAVSCRRMAGKYTQQVQEQEAQVERMKSALRTLEAKLAEARARSELLIAQRRSARAATRAHMAGAALSPDSASAAFERMKDKVEHEAAFAAAIAELTGDNVQEQLASLTRNEEVERILEELRGRAGAS